LKLSLDAAGVHEDSDLAPHRLRRQVGLELGADDARVAVRAGDLAPDAAVVGAAALGLGLVDVRHPLAAVPRDVLLGVHPLDLHQRRGLVLVRLGPLVSEDGAPDVEPHALPSAPLHHLAAAALPPEVECSGGEPPNTPATPNM